MFSFVSSYLYWSYLKKRLRISKLWHHSINDINLNIRNSEENSSNTSWRISFSYTTSFWYHFERILEEVKAITTYNYCAIPSTTKEFTIFEKDQWQERKLSIYLLCILNLDLQQFGRNNRRNQKKFRKNGSIAEGLVKSFDLWFTLTCV